MTNAVRHVIRSFGAEAQANGEGLDDFKLDIAMCCGFESWEKMPAKLQAEATRVFLDGKRLEKQADETDAPECDKCSGEHETERCEAGFCARCWESLENCNCESPIEVSGAELAERQKGT